MTTPPRLLPVRYLSSVLLAAAGYGYSVQAFAWGADGHRVTGYLAAQLLTPEARVRINEFLPAVDLGDAATWMDQERKTLSRELPSSSKWHYDNIAVCGPNAGAPNCPNGDCASSRIRHMESVLADANSSPEVKKFAIWSLIHMVGDLHQPLHAADNGDHGGNDVKVGHSNLHQQWDTAIVRKMLRKTSPQQFASGLMLKFQGRMVSWASGGPGQWLEESHRLAATVAYGGLPGFACGQPAPVLDRLSPEYVSKAEPVIEEQLAKAGVRIAVTLNRIFGQQ